MSAFELSAEETANVRAAVLYLKVRCGSWKALAKVLHSQPIALLRGQVHPLIAFKVARVAKVGVDDVLTGRYPPEGVCRHCGHGKEDAA